MLTGPAEGILPPGPCAVDEPVARVALLSPKYSGIFSLPLSAAHGNSPKSLQADRNPLMQSSYVPQSIFSLFNPAVSVHPCDCHMGPRLLQPSLFLTLLECKVLGTRGAPSPLSRVFNLSINLPSHGDRTGRPRARIYAIFRFRSPGPSRKHTSLCSAACLSCTERHLYIAMGVGGQMHMYRDRAPSQTGIDLVRPNAYRWWAAWRLFNMHASRQGTNDLLSGSCCVRGSIGGILS